MEHKRRIVDEATRWSETEYHAAVTPLGRKGTAGTDSPIVVPLVETMKGNQILALAGLWNRSRKQALDLLIVDRTVTSSLEWGTNCAIGL